MPHAKPLLNDVLTAINTLEDYSLYLKFVDNVLSGLKDINRAIDLEKFMKKNSLVCYLHSAL